MALGEVDVLEVPAPAPTVFSLSVICDLWMNGQERARFSVQGEISTGNKSSPLRCSRGEACNKHDWQRAFHHYCAERKKYLQSADLHFCPLSADFSEAIGSEGPGPVKFCFDDS